MDRWVAVGYDYNGTLLDDAKLSSEILEKIFSRFNLKVPALEQFREEVGSDYMEFFENHGIARTAQNEEIIRKIRGDFFMKNRDRIQLRPETEWLLQNCRQANLGVALVSAESELILLPQLLHYGLLEDFDSILAEARPTKENALREVGRFFEARLQRIPYIGDTSSDVIEARKVGMPTIALTNGLSSKKCLVAANPDFIADSLTEVWEIIERNSRCPSLSA